MKYLECEINHKIGYLIIIGDLHAGDKAFCREGEEKLKGYLDWVAERPNARIFLNGDLFNVATRESPTSPFTQNSGEFQAVVELFKPYKDQIIGAIPGNHEQRAVNYADINLTQLFCLNLGIPYGTTSCVVRFKINKRPNSNRYRQNYWGYFHHTTGGGSTVGGKINRVAKLQELVEGMDFYAGSHNHQLAAAPVNRFRPSMQGRKMERHIVWLVDCGSFLSWQDSYAEERMLSPAKLGSPRLRFDGLKHDLHISL